jgi:ribonuclease VapC
MAEVAVLDTSAVTALLRDEPGADEVERLLRGAGAGNIRLLASFVTLTELRYVTWRAQGEAAAERAMQLLRTWRITWVYPDEELCHVAATLKATHQMSLADAFIAATARRHQATLVHKDPEFGALDGFITLAPLPCKPRRR